MAKENKISIIILALVAIIAVIGVAMMYTGEGRATFRAAKQIGGGIQTTGSQPTAYQPPTNVYTNQPTAAYQPPTTTISPTPAPTPAPTPTTTDPAQYFSSPPALPSASYCNTVASRLKAPDRNIPSSFTISGAAQLRYREPESKWWGIAAASQTLLDYYNPNNGLSQAEIMKKLDAEDLHYISKATGRENVFMLLEQNGIPLAAYYPLELELASGAYQQQYPSGDPRNKYAAADDVRNCGSVIDQVYIDNVKDALYKTDQPVYARLRVESDTNPNVLFAPLTKRERVYADTTGIPVIITGYDTTGFTMHIFWDKNNYGGKLGGANVKYPYANFNYIGFVDSSKDYAATAAFSTKISQRDSQIEVAVTYGPLAGFLAHPPATDIIVTDQSGNRQSIGTLNWGESKTVTFSTTSAPYTITGIITPPANFADFKVSSQALPFKISASTR